MPVYTGSYTISKLPAPLATSEEAQKYLHGSQNNQSESILKIHTTNHTKTPLKKDTEIKGLIF